jgi:hypothetical protein
MILKRLRTFIENNNIEKEQSFRVASSHENALNSNPLTDYI